MSFRGPRLQDTKLPLSTVWLLENLAEAKGRQRPKHGSKTELVEYALQNMISPFGIADVKRLCPNVSRDTIRLVMNRRRQEGRLEMIEKGRDAKWNLKKGK